MCTDDEGPSLADALSSGDNASNPVILDRAVPSGPHDAYLISKEVRYIYDNQPKIFAWKLSEEEEKLGVEYDDQLYNLFPSIGDAIDWRILEVFSNNNANTDVNPFVRALELSLEAVAPADKKKEATRLCDFLFVASRHPHAQETAKDNGLVYDLLPPLGEKYDVLGTPGIATLAKALMEGKASSIASAQIALLIAQVTSAEAEWMRIGIGFMSEAYNMPWDAILIGSHRLPSSDPVLVKIRANLKKTISNDPSASWLSMFFKLSDGLYDDVAQQCSELRLDTVAELLLAYRAQVLSLAALKGHENLPENPVKIYVAHATTNIIIARLLVAGQFAAVKELSKDLEKRQPETGRSYPKGVYTAITTALCDITEILFNFLDKKTVPKDPLTSLVKKWAEEAKVSTDSPIFNSTIKGMHRKVLCQWVEHVAVDLRTPLIPIATESQEPKAVVSFFAVEAMGTLIRSVYESDLAGTELLFSMLPPPIPNPYDLLPEDPFIVRPVTIAHAPTDNIAALPPPPVSTAHGAPSVSSANAQPPVPSGDVVKTQPALKGFGPSHLKGDEDKSWRHAPRDVRYTQQAQTREQHQFQVEYHTAPQDIRRQTAQENRNAETSQQRNTQAGDEGAASIASLPDPLSLAGGDAGPSSRRGRNARSPRSPRSPAPPHPSVSLLTPAEEQQNSSLLESMPVSFACAPGLKPFEIRGVPAIARPLLDQHLQQEKEQDMRGPGGRGDGVTSPKLPSKLTTPLLAGRELCRQWQNGKCARPMDCRWIHAPYADFVRVEALIRDGKRDREDEREIEKLVHQVGKKDPHFSMDLKRRIDEVMKTDDSEGKKKMSHAESFMACRYIPPSKSTVTPTSGMGETPPGLRDLVISPPLPGIVEGPPSFFHTASDTAEEGVSTPQERVTPDGIKYTFTPPKDVQDRHIVNEPKEEPAEPAKEESGGFLENLLRSENVDSSSAPTPSSSDIKVASSFCATAAIDIVLPPPVVEGEQRLSPPLMPGYKAKKEKTWSPMKEPLKQPDLEPGMQLMSNAFKMYTAKERAAKERERAPSTTTAEQWSIEVKEQRERVEAANVDAAREKKEEEEKERKQAEEHRLAAVEAQKKEEENRRLEEESRRVEEEEKRRQEEETRRVEEKRKLEEEESRRAEEEMRKQAEEEKRRQEEETRRVEEKRKLEEEESRRAEDELRKQAEEKRRQEEVCEKERVAKEQKEADLRSDVARIVAEEAMKNVPHGMAQSPRRDSDEDEAEMKRQIEAIQRQYTEKKEAKARAKEMAAAAEYTVPSEDADDENVFVSPEAQVIQVAAKVPEETTTDCTKDPNSAAATVAVDTASSSNAESSKTDEAVRETVSQESEASHATAETGQHTRGLLMSPIPRGAEPRLVCNNPPLRIMSSGDWDDADYGGGGGFSAAGAAGAAAGSGGFGATAPSGGFGASNGGGRGGYSSGRGGGGGFGGDRGRGGGRGGRGRY